MTTRRICFVKTSSLGDLYHSFPALSDLQAHHPEVRVDWVVEEGFRDVPAWHPIVDRTITVGLRSWRRAPLSPATWRAAQASCQALREQRYERVIDAQALTKSALITQLIRGPSHGYDSGTAREPWISWSYDNTHTISRVQHAISRTRALMAAAMGYTIDPSSPLRYGLGEHTPDTCNPYVMLIHGTTWQNKMWPLSHWRAICQQARQAALQVHIPWGSDGEYRFAQAIAEGMDHVTVLPRLSLADIKDHLQRSQGVMAVDTGLAHLSAAVEVPTLALFGPTRPDWTGVMGVRAATYHAEEPPCAPCMKRTCALEQPHADWPPCMRSLSPAQVWQRLTDLMVDHGADRSSD